MPFNGTACLLPRLITHHLVILLVLGLSSLLGGCIAGIGGGGLQDSSGPEISFSLAQDSVITADTALQIVASDAGSGPTTSFEVWLDGTHSPEDQNTIVYDYATSVSAATTMQIVHSSLAIGPHTVRVKVWDFKQNSSEETFRFTIAPPGAADTQGPVITFSMATGQTITEDSNLTIDAVDSQSNITAFEVLLDEASVHSTAPDALTAQFVLALIANASEAGDHSVVVHATDAVGNMTEESFSYTVLTGGSGDTTPPEVFINNLIDMEVLAGSHTITVLGRDLESGLDTMRVSIDNVVVYEQAMAPGAIQFTHEIELVNVDNDTDQHVIKAYCSNRDGLETEVSMAYSFEPVV